MFLSSILSAGESCAGRKSRLQVPWSHWKKRAGFFFFRREDEVGPRKPYRDCLRVVVFGCFLRMLFQLYHIQSDSGSIAMEHEAFEHVFLKMKMGISYCCRLLRSVSLQKKDSV